MLTLEDCIEICGLSKDELRYLEDHEHITELQAAGLAERYVVLNDKGVPHLRRTILEDIRELTARNRADEARALECFVRDFVLSHPGLNRLRSATRPD